MRQNARTVLLLALIAAITAGILWRWLWVARPALDTVRVTLNQAQAFHPIDGVLRNHWRALQQSPALLPALIRAPETVRIQDLWIDRCEVSQRQFAGFRQWRVLQTPSEIAAMDHPTKPADFTYRSMTAGHKLLGRLNMPASGVSYYEAYAYCQAAGGRLPTAREFEAMASDAHGNAPEISASLYPALYPWGNEVSPEVIAEGWPYRDAALNIQACPEPDDTANHATQNAIGVQNLGDNILEWVEDSVGGGAALMGGSAFDRPVALFSLNRLKRMAARDYRSQYSGFRCVYDAPAPHTVQKAHHNTADLALPWVRDTATILNISEGTYALGYKNARIPELLARLPTEQWPSLTFLGDTAATTTLAIMRHEVRVAHYARFLQDPLRHLGIYDHPRQPEHTDHTPTNWAAQRTMPNAPITHIAWWSAYAFAKWAGGRLPSEEEWQAAAAPNTTLYPWGNDYAPGLAFDRAHPANTGRVADVDISTDATPDGLAGFAAHVAEWTRSAVPYANAYQMVIKGGSFYLPEDAGQARFVNTAPPDYVAADLGFRVVFDTTSQ